MHLPYDMNGLWVDHDFAIFHKLHVPLILGLDFLQKSDTDIDSVSHTHNYLLGVNTTPTHGLYG